MVKGKKIIVVMPAYNASKTLRKTIEEIPSQLVDEIILVDDYSSDNTKQIAKQVGIKKIIRHDSNKGYGGNQKTCYKAALDEGADIIIMLHPDYQYSPKLLPAIVELLASGLYDCVIASRILGKGALKGGMPLYKYLANRFLTLFQNTLTNNKLSEYHTGYRGYTRTLLQGLPFFDNSDNFVFDNEFLCQILYAKYRVAEVSCPTKYFADASSINFSRSVKYGLGVLRVSWLYFFAKAGIYRAKLFQIKSSAK